MKLWAGNCEASVRPYWAAVGSLYRRAACNREVGSWHETDMPSALSDVRSWGQSGKHVLAMSFSGFDPQETFCFSAIFYCARAICRLWEHWEQKYYFIRHLRAVQDSQLATTPVSVPFSRNSKPMAKARCSVLT